MEIPELPPAPINYRWVPAVVNYRWLAPGCS